MFTRPGAVTLAAEITSRNLTKAEEGGWTFPAVAQFYGIVNDRLMIFLRGSGAKTVKERGQGGKVKITDGHPWEGEVSRALGKVLESRETRSGVRYTGFISSAEEKTAQKISDGTIDENSLEISAIERVDRLVDIERVPERARDFVSLNSEGKARVHGIRSWRWDAIGLVIESSQGKNAITGPPTLVTAADTLAISRAPWIPETAAEQLQSWGAGSSIKLAAAHLGQFHSPNGEIVLAGQVAAPSEDGHLIINVHAIPDALDELEEKLQGSALSERARAETLRAAHEQAGNWMIQIGAGLTSAVESGTSEEGAEEIASEEPEASLVRPPQASNPATASLDPSRAEDAASHTTAGSPPTVGSENAAKLAAQIAYLDRSARLRELTRRYREVANGLPTTSSSGPAGPGHPGSRRAPARR